MDSSGFGTSLSGAFSFFFFFNERRTLLIVFLKGARERVHQLGRHKQNLQ